MSHQPSIHCRPGLTAVIPEHLRNFPITLTFLTEKNACKDGKYWFAAIFPAGCTYTELREKLAAENKPDWESWIQQRLGGDIATSGYMGTSTSGYMGTSTSGDGGTSTSGNRGTSTSGYMGTSTSGNRGTSTSGNRGTSTSGYMGTSTSGDVGTSTSGNRGTSTSGYMGTSTSGDRGTSTSDIGGTSTSGIGGVISIFYWDNKTNRRKVMIGYIGENGLKPNVAYRLDENAQFVEATKL